MTLPVFLVEDDPRIQADLIEVIRSASIGHVVATASTEREAVQWLRNNESQWGLTVLDLFLAQGTGFGVLKAIEPRSLRGKVIVLTNSATSQNRRACMDLGACAVFDKTEELAEFLAHCLRYDQTALGRRLESKPRVDCNDRDAEKKGGFE